MRLSLCSQKVSFKNLRKTFVSSVRKASPEIKVSIEPKVDIFYRPDVVLSDDGTKILVELISSTYPQNILRSIYQVVGYERLVSGKFESILLIIPEDALVSLRLKKLIDRVQKKLPKLQIMKYSVSANKLIFTRVTSGAFPLPETFSSDLPATFTVSKSRRVSLSAPKAMRVVKYLLTHKETTQMEIASRADVSVGHVNKIVTHLIEQEIAKYKGKKLVLSEPWKLLNEISWFRSMDSLKVSDWFVPDRYPTIEDLEKRIKQILENMDARYALTLFSAAKRHTSYMKKYDIVQLYIDAFDETRSALIKAKLKPVERGQVHVEIFEPDSEDILRESMTSGGFKICSPIQTVIDLSCYGTIGRELAIELYSKIRADRF